MANFLEIVNTDPVSAHDQGRVSDSMWPGYAGHDHSAVWRTWSYVYNCCKKGTFVQFRQGKLVTFAKFSNPRFSNGANFDRDYMLDLVDRAREIQGYGPLDRKREALHPDRWAINGSLFRYDNVSESATGPNKVIMRAQLELLQARREVPDCDFILNARDYPLVSKTAHRPYPQAYGPDAPLPEPWKRNFGGPLIPVMSVCSGPDYADLPVPTYECAAHAFSLEGIDLRAFGGRFTTTPLEKDLPLWKDKKSLAVFRGSSTGSGTTAETNQRLAAVSLGRPDLIDAGITKWTLRPRKRTVDKKYSIIEPTGPVSNTMTPLDIAGYKYVLCPWGNAPAFRLLRDLSLGSVVLLPSTPPGQEELKMWFYNKLKPWVHYVPVSGDLSDLVDAIVWCRENDVESQAIAARGQSLARKTLSMEGQLDYWLETISLFRSTFSPEGYNSPPSPSTFSHFMVERHLASLPRYEQLPQPNRPGPKLPRCSGTLRGLRYAADLGWDLGQTAKERQTTMAAGLLGLEFFNKLIARVPHFRYTFKLTDSYSALQEVNPGEVSLADWLVKMGGWRKERQLALMLCQITAALDEAQAAGGAVLGDLSTATVHAVPGPHPEYVYHDGRGGSFGLKFLPADWWVLISHGPSARARIKLLERDGRRGWTVTVGPQPCYPGLSERCWHDVCTILSSILRTLRTVKGSEQLAGKIIRAAGASYAECAVEANEVSDYWARVNPLTTASPHQFRMGIMREFGLTDQGWAWVKEKETIEKVLRPWERGLPTYLVNLWNKGSRSAALKACALEVLRKSPPRPETMLAAHQMAQTYTRVAGMDLDVRPEWTEARNHIMSLWKPPAALGRTERDRQPPPPCQDPDPFGPCWALPLKTRAPGSFPEWFDPATVGNRLEALGQGFLGAESWIELGQDLVAGHCSWEYAAQLAFNPTDWDEDEKLPFRREMRAKPAFERVVKDANV
ncbi:hypothetical protein [Largemouth bass virus]|uniref:Glycosyl transferase CAP10 domain-containing protein n=1 Tax=Largemouth bass virus TaxID=176656 RepID=A0A9E7TN23_9VIRU|nr:putative tyrosine kinase [Mandarin fish ranavirus]UUY86214.1 hypothetical protein [Largemouth bass virus]WEI29052.1 hypothetical protein [Largemouth bass virus]WHA35515.1 putative tyrosine kinase [Micropterus salmoides ranavirus]WHA35620.1 putative tyrosine kinase [Siniperca chuatsi ranavirus]